jgi:hypothetical protein
MSKKLLVELLFIVGFFGFIRAQEGNFYYENAVYKEEIKTVQMYRDGFVIIESNMGNGRRNPAGF